MWDRYRPSVVQGLDLTWAILDSIVNNVPTHLMDEMEEKFVAELKELFAQAKASRPVDEEKVEG